MGLTDEKYPALMFSFSKNSPLDLMTPEYGCCLLKKNISFHSDVLSTVLLFCFPYCSVICFRGRYQHQDSSKKKEDYKYCKSTCARSALWHLCFQPSFNFLSWIFFFFLTKIKAAFSFKWI